MSAVKVSHSRAIVFLLAAILIVLVFGAHYFLLGLAWVAGICAIVGIMFLVIAGFSRIISSLRAEVATAKADGGPWLCIPVGYLAVIGIFIVGGVAAFDWMSQPITYKDALTQVPLWWVPVALMVGGVVVLLIESAHEWLPKVPEFAAKILRGWIMWLVSPIAGPMGHLQRLRETKSKGETTGIFSDTLNLLWTFIVGLCFSLFAISVGMLFFASLINFVLFFLF
jgi:hypothetical protein